MAPEGFVNVPSWDVAGNSRLPQYRHLDTVNMLFLDGRIKSVKKGQIQETTTSEDGTALTGDQQFVLWNTIAVPKGVVARSR